MKCGKSQKRTKTCRNESEFFNMWKSVVRPDDARVRTINSSWMKITCREKKKTFASVDRIASLLSLSLDRLLDSRKCIAFIRCEVHVLFVGFVSAREKKSNEIVRITYLKLFRWLNRRFSSICRQCSVLFNLFFFAQERQKQIQKIEQPNERE